VAMSSSNVDITGTKEMCSVSVSHSKVLLFLVVNGQWKYGVYLSIKYVRNRLTH
jgi:hypothetical protein